MHRFFELFGQGKPADWNKKVITPVIHLPGYDEAFEAAYREIMIARNAGADGAILISHGRLNSGELTEVWQFASSEIAKTVGPFPIGINWLGLTDFPGEMIYRAAEADIPIVWSDATTGEAEIKKAREATGWGGLYCGAFAFKYQEIVANDDLPKVLERAFGYMDVPITSGEATGVPIDLTKASICHEAAAGRPIGLASGFSVENASNLLPFFDWFYVSSALARDGDFYRHDPAKVREHVDITHNWRPEGR